MIVITYLDSEETIRTSSPPNHLSTTHDGGFALPYSAERQTWLLWIPIFKVFGLTRPIVEPEFTVTLYTWSLIELCCLMSRYVPCWLLLWQGLVITKKKLANGYRRFDPQRGMEYILDLILNVLLEGTTDPIEINHRVELLRPLSEVRS